jgi:hypothetical protein
LARARLALARSEGYLRGVNATKMQCLPAALVHAALGRCAVGVMDRDLCGGQKRIDGLSQDESAPADSDRLQLALSDQFIDRRTSQASDTARIINSERFRSGWRESSWATLGFDGLNVWHLASPTTSRNGRLRMEANIGNADLVTWTTLIGCGVFYLPLRPPARASQMPLNSFL